MKKLASQIAQKPIIVIIAISLAVILLFLIFEYKLTKGQFGAPLDDVYIHFQFSKNLAEGNGFSFNAGEPIPGSTSPGWTVLITFFYLFIKNHLLIAKSLSAIFYVLSGITTYFLGLEIFKSKKWGLLTAIFTTLTGRLAWSALSGMEITLFTFLLTLALLLYLKKKNQYLIVLILAIASTVRPEGYSIFTFYFLTELLRSFQSLQSSRSFRSLRSLIITVLIYLSIITPYLLFSYSTTGNILPNTFLAQSIAGTSIAFKAKSALLYILRYCYLLLTDNPIIAIALPFGTYQLFKSTKKEKGRYLLIMLIAIGFPIVASVTAPNLRHHGRYIMPFTPLYVLIGLLGIKAILRKLTSQRLVCLSAKGRTAFGMWQKRLLLPNVTFGISLSLVFLYLLVIIINWASTFGWNVKNINDMHVHLGNWVRENTREDSVIALNDIGAITYISQRKVIDTIGLVSPDVLNVIGGLSKEEREGPLWNFLKEKQPDYLIIMPSWYPEISKKEDLQEVYKVQLDRYTIVDGEMVVYRFNR